MGKRRQPVVLEDWTQLELLLPTAEQRAYELIRPIVLFGQTPGARAAETGAPAYTLRRKAKRFATHGMVSLFETPPAPLPPPVLPQAIPPELRQLVIDLKVEHPPLRVHEIQTICYIRTGRRPHTTTVARLLHDASPLPARRERRFLPYHQIADPAQRRAVIVRLHLEGWVKKAITDYLETSRETVHATLRRWVAEGLKGLYSRSRAPHRRHPKATLRVIHEVHKLQHNPRLGEFRVHGHLKQLGIHLSPRTCGRILALNRRLYADLCAEDAQHDEKPAKHPMPFAATRRHQYWTVDIRYLDMHQLGGGMIYAITILENYSRAVLASAVTRTQDLGAYLLVLFAAIRQHGAPEALVSDGGAVFRAAHAMDIYETLGVRKEQIAKRQAWQSYIETNFNVMRRMADWGFEHATTWAELVVVHDRWLAISIFSRIGHIGGVTIIATVQWEY